MSALDGVNRVKRTQGGVVGVLLFLLVVWAVDGRAEVTEGVKLSDETMNSIVETMKRNPEMEKAFIAFQTDKLFEKIKRCYEKQAGLNGKRLDDDCRDTLMLHDLLSYESED